MSELVGLGNVKVSPESRDWLKAEAARRGVSVHVLVDEMVTAGRTQPNLEPRGDVHLGSNASIPPHEHVEAFHQSVGFHCKMCGVKMPNPHMGTAG